MLGPGDSHLNEVAISSLTDESLVKQAQAGQTAAFAELYRRHAPAIFRYFLLRLGDQAHAEDLTSDVFTRVLEGLPNYEVRGAPFPAWLFRVAHGLYVDHVRRAHRRPLEQLEEHWPAEAETLDTQAAQNQAHQALQVALQQLKEDQKTVVQLRFIEGHNLEETAHLMRRTIGAIKALQYRAMERLAQLLAPPRQE